MLSVFKQDGKFYRGWCAALVGFLCIFFGQMFYTNCMALYTGAITKQFGWDRSQFVFWTTISAATMMISSPFIGKLYKKYQPKIVMAIILVIQSLGYLGFAFSSELWQFRACAVLLGIGFAGIIRMGPSVAVNMWFGPKLKGTAMAVVTSSTGIGAICIVPMISKIIIAHGYQYGYFATIAFNILVFLPIILLCLDTPEKCGVSRKGELSDGEIMEKKNKDMDGVDLELKDAIKTPEFFLTGLGQILIGVIATGLITNVTLYFTDIGFSQQTAAWLSSITWATGILGKIVLGWMVSKFGVKITALVAGTMYSCAFVGLLLMQVSPAFVILYAAGYAVGSGITIFVPPLMVPVMWGQKNNAPNFGAVNLCSGIGSVFGSYLIARVYDVAKTYTIAWVVLAILMLVACLCFFFAVGLADKRNALLRKNIA